MAELAEREGFEPSVPVSQYTGLANLAHTLYIRAVTPINIDRSGETTTRRNNMKTQNDADENGSKVAHASPVRKSRFQRAVAAVPDRSAPEKALTRHEAIVAKILEQWEGSRRFGFMTAIKAEPPDFVCDPTLRIIPDAFLMDHEDGCAAAFEVECSHKVSAEKYSRYQTLAWELDEVDWTVILIRYDHLCRPHVTDVLYDCQQEVLAAARRVIAAR